MVANSKIAQHLNSNFSQASIGRTKWALRYASPKHSQPQNIRVPPAPLHQQLRIHLEELDPVLPVLARPPHQLLALGVPGAPGPRPVLEDVAHRPSALARRRLGEVAGQHVVGHRVAAVLVGLPVLHVTPPAVAGAGGGGGILVLAGGGGGRADRQPQKAEERRDRCVANTGNVESVFRWI